MASIQQDQASPALSMTQTASPPAAQPQARPNLARLRGPAFGVLSIALFILAWHLLTTYRANLVIRFTNVPTPASVVSSAQQAAQDPDFVYDLLVSCQRIAIGFLAATAIGVPVA